MTDYLEVTFRQVENFYGVTAGDRKVILPPTPARILAFLVAHPNTTHLLRTVVQAVYDAADKDEPVTSDQAVRTQIRILRNKLAAGGLFLDLENEPYRGYTFHGVSLFDGQQPSKGRRPAPGGDVPAYPASRPAACADVPWTFPAYRERKTRR